MGGEADPGGIVFQRRHTMGPVTDPKRSPDFDVRLGGMNAVRRRLVPAGLALAMAFAAASGPAAAQDKAAQDKPAQDKADRYVGYYYPKPAAIETYKARAAVLPGANRKRRIAFIVAVVNERLQRPYPPAYSLFPKGGRAHKLIIVSNLPGQPNTIYRVRALLATMTSVARSLPIFRDHSVEDDFTFLDLMKMLGFESVTVSDGESFTHQIILR
mgnify:CR=1 FL=1